VVRTAVFKSANELVGCLLQQAADRLDAVYQPKLGEVRKGQQTSRCKALFGSFPLSRDYYHHPGKDRSHCPADAALDWKLATHPPCQADLLGRRRRADLPESGAALGNRLAHPGFGAADPARGPAGGRRAQKWQERPAQPGRCDAPIMYVSADGTGVPMVPEELAGGAASKPMARPRPGKSIWVASLPSTVPTSRGIRCATGNPPLMYRASNPAMSSVPACGKRRSAAAWPVLAKWWCSSTARRAWSIWASTTSRTACKSWT